MSTITNKITISELSRLLGISRPTMYKYISSFDDGNSDEIPEEFLDILKFIDENEIYSKDEIYNYCMSKFMATSSKGLMDRVKVLNDSNEDFHSLLSFLITNSAALDFKDVLEKLGGNKNGK